MEGQPLKGSGKKKNKRKDESKIVETHLTLDQVADVTKELNNLSLGKTGLDNVEKLIEKLQVSRQISLKEEKIFRRKDAKFDIEKEVGARAAFEDDVNPLLPQLAWSDFMKKLGNPRDKVELSRMNGFWRGLLKKDQTTFLFNLVIPNLCANGHIMPKDIRNCRVVCKEWKRSVDNCLQQIYKQVEFSKARKHLKQAPIPFWFISSEDIQNFIRDFTVTYPSENPFYSRHLVFGEVPRQLKKQHFLQHIELLKLWGDQIWTFGCAIQYTEPIMLHEMLVAMLKLMPNLKSLSIDYSVASKDENPFMIRREYQFEHCTTALPPLPHLENLIMPYVPVPMMKFYLKTYGKSLLVVALNGKETDSFQMMLSMKGESPTFPKLEHLTCHNETSVASREDANMAKNFPNLIELHLKVRNTEGVDGVNLFERVNKIGKRLRHLMIILHKYRWNGQCTKFSEEQKRKMWLHLPNLETINIHVNRVSMATIDFMMPLKSLKEVGIFYMQTKDADEAPKTKAKGSGKQKASNSKGKGKGSSSKNEASSSTGKPTPSSSGTASTSSKGAEMKADQLLQYKGFEKALYSSNIWNLLPDLRRVEISVVTQTNPPYQLFNSPDGRIFPYRPQLPLVKTTVKIYTVDGFKEYRQDKN